MSRKQPLTLAIEYLAELGIYVRRDQQCTEIDDSIAISFFVPNSRMEKEIAHLRTLAHPTNVTKGYISWCCAPHRSRYGVYGTLTIQHRGISHSQVTLINLR